MALSLFLNSIFTEKILTLFRKVKKKSLWLNGSILPKWKKMRLLKRIFLWQLVEKLPNHHRPKLQQVGFTNFFFFRFSPLFFNLLIIKISSSTVRHSSRPQRPNRRFEETESEPEVHQQQRRTPSKRQRSTSTASPRRRPTRSTRSQKSKNRYYYLDYF